MPQRIPCHRPLRLRASRLQRDESTRPNAAARGYCSVAHKKWRQAVLTRDAWQCQHCGRVAQRMAQADHIVPISKGGARYDVANGQTLCIKCHGRKTREEQQREWSGKHAATTAKQTETIPVACQTGGRQGG